MTFKGCGTHECLFYLPRIDFLLTKIVTIKAKFNSYCLNISQIIVCLPNRGKTVKCPSSALHSSTPALNPNFSFLLLFSASASSQLVFLELICQPGLVQGGGKQDQNMPPNFGCFIYLERKDKLCLHHLLPPAYGIL